MAKNRKSQQEPPRPAMTIKNTRCKVMAVEECQKKNLTPLCVYQGNALVPDWNIVMSSRAGWKKELDALRLAGFAYLSGKQETPPQRATAEELLPEPAFDLAKYTRKS